MSEIIVFCWWIILFLFFCGSGYFFFSLLQIKPQGAQGYINTFWVGWAFSLFLLQAVNFFLPVDIRCFFIVAGVSFLGIFRAKSIFPFFRTNRFKLAVLSLPMFFLILPVANAILFPALHYDSGLYHLQAVKWAKVYPVVPGLGNLHGRLAFNSAYFLYIALLDAITGKGSRLGQGLLYFVFMLQVVLSVYKIIFSRGKCAFSSFFSLLLLYALLMSAHNIFMSSPTPDLAVYILGLFSAQQLIFLSEKISGKNQAIEEEALSLIMVSTAGIIVKLSYLVMGSTTMIIVAVLLKNRICPEEKNKLFIKAALCAAAGIVPWIVRNIILSGYVFYPWPIFPFPVEWRIPLASVKAQAHSIATCARTGIDIDAPPWMEYFVVPWAMTAIGMITLLWCRFAGRGTRPLSRVTYIFLAPSLAAAIFWFFIAPNLRFAGSAFFILGLGTLAIALYEVLNRKPSAGFKLFAAGYLIFCFFRIYQVPFVPHNSFSGFYDDLPVASKKIVTVRGDNFYLPVETDQCFAAPLPCTPYLNKNLSYRCRGNLGCGFVLDPRSEDDAHAGLN